MHKAKQDMLVLAAQQGNERAFAFLYKHYQPAVLRFAYKLCSNQTLAQDAVQDAWLKIAKKLRTLNDPRAFKSWLYRAVRWQVIDAATKSSEQFEVPLADNEPSSIIELNSDTDNEQFGSLIRLIDKLPDIDKQAVYLFYLEDMKIPEIADVLQIPQGTVKSRLNRSRNKLREQTENRGKDDEHRRENQKRTAN